MNPKDKYVDLYNEAYSFVTPEFLASGAKLQRYLRENSHSLILFLKSYLERHGGLSSLVGKNILEVGCGLGGLSQELTKLGAHVHGVDISPMAIMGAREVNQANKQVVKYSVMDVCSKQNLEMKFDYILDSHLLHCLTSKVERNAYFSFVKNHLSKNGFFLAETMTFQPDIQEVLGYDIDENYILHKEIEGVKKPIRLVLPSLNLEQEITQNGMNIDTFYYHHELSLNIFPEYPDYPEFRRPRIVRYSAKL